MELQESEDEKPYVSSGNFEDKGIGYFEKEHNWTNYPKGVLISQEAGMLPIDSGMEVYVHKYISKWSGLFFLHIAWALIGVIEKLYIFI